MRVFAGSLAVGTALLAPTAHAYSGGPGLLTLDGLPPDIVFTEGVPQEITVTLRARRRPSSTLCHGDTLAQITIPGVIEAVYPCYSLAYDPSIPSPEISGGYCNASIGDEGEIYPMSGDTFPAGDDQTFNVILSYDGSAPSIRHGEWILWSDGKCGEIAPTIMREAGSINIHILPPSEAHEDGFVATSTTPYYNYFFIDHPELNDNPDARFIITPFAQEETPTSAHHGVWYYAPWGRWGIYREDGSAMPEGSDFVVALGGERSFLHTTNPSNTTSYVTYLDDDRINDNPNAAIFVTHNWSPPGGGSAYHDHAVGVYYNPWNRRWMIYNEDTGSDGLWSCVQCRGRERLDRRLGGGGRAVARRQSGDG